MNCKTSNKHPADMFCFVFVFDFVTKFIRYNRIKSINVVNNINTHLSLK